MIDSDDYPNLCKFAWSINGTGYPVGYINGRLVYLHRYLASAPNGTMVDHVSGDVLDNRKANLRICTPGENQCNIGLKSHNTSGHIGVSWYKRHQKWRVQVKRNHIIYSGGYHATKESAILARAELAKRLHGNFVKLA